MKEKTKSQPSATQPSSLQFLVMRGHSISQAGCCRSGLRRINKFMWRKLAQHLPTICQFTLSLSMWIKFSFSTWRVIFFFLIILYWVKCTSPSCEKNLNLKSAQAQEQHKYCAYTVNDTDIKILKDLYVNIYTHVQRNDSKLHLFWF